MLSVSPFSTFASVLDVFRGERKKKRSQEWKRRLERKATQVRKDALNHKIEERRRT
jgi:polynucleotide 5'-kinase involved in rRNA processing